MPDQHARDDVFQECALTLWRQFEQFDAKRSFGAWAREVAANLILQRRDQDQRFPIAFSPETIQAVVDAYDRTESAATAREEALADCLEELPEHSRQMLAERYEKLRKPAEIAEATGRSLDAVYQALSRLRARLEECIRRRLGTKERATSYPRG